MKFNSYDICKNCRQCYGNHRVEDGACPTFSRTKKFALNRSATKDTGNNWILKHRFHTTQEN